MWTRPRKSPSILKIDGGEFKRCECGALFEVEFNSRGQRTTRKLCDACRRFRMLRKGDEFGFPEGVARCEGCSAGVGIEWGSVLSLDESGYCRDCAEWRRKAEERARLIARRPLWTFGTYGRSA